MSFWNNPSASFEQLGRDPWHSLQNFTTTGLVPMIPYVAGAVGGAFGGPVGAAGAGGAAQSAIDYFSGNSEARTGSGMLNSAKSGAAKGSLGNLGNSLPGMAEGNFDIGTLQKLLNQIPKGTLEDSNSNQGSTNPTQQVSSNIQRKAELQQQAAMLRQHIAFLKSQQS